MAPASSIPSTELPCPSQHSFSEETGGEGRLDESGQETPKGRKGSLGLCDKGLYQQPALQGPRSACFTRNSCENRYPRPLKGRAGTIKAAPGVQLGSHQLWTNRSWTPAPETRKKTGGGSSEIPALPHPWARRVRLGNSEAFLTLVPLLQTPLAPRLPTRTTTIHPRERPQHLCNHQDVALHVEDTDSESQEE